MAIQRPPGPKGSWLTGIVSDFAAGPHEELAEMAQTYGEVVHFRLLNKHFYLLSNPDYIREVLVKQAKKFEKSQLDKTIMGKFMGNGLVTSDGSFHKRQRSLAQPAFHKQRIANYAETMVDYTAQMLEEWNGQPRLMVDEEMNKLTMYIVTKTLFDAEVSGDAGQIGHAIHELQNITNMEFNRGFSTPDWIPTPSNRERKTAVFTLDTTINQIVAERLAQATDGDILDRGDLLSMLMLAVDEEGNRMSDLELRDELVTLFVAGHETTSNALSWTWYLLSQHPEVEAKLHKEVDNALNGRLPTLADLRSLPYTLQVLKESMRIFPPVWNLNGRTALEDVEIGGYTIPKGDEVFLSPYVMHHHPQYFPEPSRFDPERFTPENEAKLPRYAYMPFGGGPRVCIGNSFAMMEAQLIIAAIAQRYRLRLDRPTPVQPLPRITMSPDGGLPMRLEPRTAVHKTAPATNFAIA